MLAYSELSDAQKRVVERMRKGVELQHNGDFFEFADKTFVQASTAESLIRRHFIRPCYHDPTLTVYCLTPDIEFGDKVNDKK